MGKRPKVTVLGSLNMDISVTVPRLPGPGATVLGSAARFTPGGKGANQAVAAARLGADVRMVGCVGDDDFGRRLLAAIEKELPRVAAERSGTELTATERHVADLIAAGATNRDAAAALFVSVRTIETHVASIYRKLGVRTRSELTRRTLGS